MTSKKNMGSNRKPRRIHRNKGGRQKGSVDGYYIANGNFTNAFGAFYLFFINSVFIGLSRMFFFPFSKNVAGLSSIFYYIILISKVNVQNIPT